LVFKIIFFSFCQKTPKKKNKGGVKTKLFFDFAPSGVSRPREKFFFFQ